MSFTVIAAAKGRQESFEMSDRAAVDANSNGVIELSEFYRRIKPSILTLMNGNQTPWLARVDMIGEVPLF